MKKDFVKMQLAKIILNYFNASDGIFGQLDLISDAITCTTTQTCQ